MPVFMNYILLALWLLMGLWIGLRALIGNPVKGGMVRTRPPLRSSWPLLTVVWIASSFVLFAIISPH